VPADAFVFSHEVAGRRPWRPNWVTKRFIIYRRQAGLAAFRLHDLRHFMATTMLAAGVPVPVVSERLCHAVALSERTGRILGHGDLYRVAPKPSIGRGRGSLQETSSLWLNRAAEPALWGD
jgi:integrase